MDECVFPNVIDNAIAHRLDLSVVEGMAELGLLRDSRSGSVRRRGGRFLRVPEGQGRPLPMPSP